VLMKIGFRTLLNRWEIPPARVPGLPFSAPDGGDVQPHCPGSRPAPSPDVDHPCPIIPNGRKETTSSDCPPSFLRLRRPLPDFAARPMY